YGSSLSVVNGGNPNGAWLLYVLDDAVGDAGYIASGWSLDLSTATTLRSLADLSVAMTSVPTSLIVGATLTNTIWITNLGPASASGIYLTNRLSNGQQTVVNV